MRCKKIYLVQVISMLSLLLLLTGCSRHKYEINDNKSIILDTEYNEFRDGETTYSYEIYDSRISLYYPEGYRFTYDSYLERFTGFDEEEYQDAKEKYVDPEELVRILDSQPKREGVLGFIGMMLLAYGFAIYFYPDMFYTIRGLWKSQFLIPSESEYPVIRKISISSIILGIFLFFLYMIG
ncbi:MAG: hypothetical protein QM657_07695 [Lacrimispora sp.]|uniref:hypothetical protein n=1 Tax=Lacrimispora sp. TaxID=2719234 RepID=UPI0039E6EDD8